MRKVWKMSIIDILRAPISDESFELLKFIFHSGSGCCGVSSIIISRRSRRILVIFRLHERWFNSAFVCDHLKLISQLLPSKTPQGDEKTLKRIEHFFLRRWSRAIVDVPLNSTCKSNLIVQKKRKMRWKNQQTKFVFVYLFLKTWNIVKMPDQPDDKSLEKYKNIQHEILCCNRRRRRGGSLIHDEWNLQFDEFIFLRVSSKKRFICHGRVEGTRMCAILKLALV